MTDSDPSPARKPGMSTTGRPSPRGTPRPWNTGSTSSRASSACQRISWRCRPHQRRALSAASMGARAASWTSGRAWSGIVEEAAQYRFRRRTRRARARTCARRSEFRAARSIRAMALREVEGPAGAPWEGPMAGTLDRLVVESELLAGNPLGDPARRPLYVYRPPGVDLERSDGVPAVYVIQGFTGQLDMWLNRTTREPTMVERLDAMFAAGDCPDAVIVFVDA